MLTFRVDLSRPVSHHVTWLALYQCGIRLSVTKRNCDLYVLCFSKRIGEADLGNNEFFVQGGLL